MFDEELGEEVMERAVNSSGTVLEEAWASIIMSQGL